MSDTSAYQKKPRAILTKRAIVVSAVIVITVGVGAAVALFLLYPPRDSRSAVEIVRTAGTIAVGTGGGAGLLLAALRQRATEQANEDLREANENVRHDAQERRISELQASAGEQLGNEKAAVRLNGLYQLERLGQNYPDHRQTVVNVLCAYLRMPFMHADTLTAEPERSEHTASAGNESQTGTETDIKPAREELQVRLTAQRVLAEHLRTDPHDKFWNDISLDLTGAVLIGFDISHCCLRSGRFNSAHFLDVALFSGAHFTGTAWFRGARFEDAAGFNNAQFDELVWFERAYFKDISGFHRTQFKALAWFNCAQFEGPARFLEAEFADTTRFVNVRCRWGVNRTGDNWPEGWATQAPENDEDGRIEDREGTWGYVVEDATQKLDAEPGNKA